MINKQNVIWSPLKGSQNLAMSCNCNHILYDGTRGPGKTDVQLMYYRRFVGLGYGQFWKGVVFDTEYKSLDDIISRSKKWFYKFNDGAKFINSVSQLKWVWPSGEELYFRVMKTEADYWKYHGQEFPFIGWNELTKHPNSILYDSALSLNRTSFLPEEHSPDYKILPPIPLVIFTTTNPYGVGHSWVKTKFIDVAPAGKVVEHTKNVFNPQTQKRENITKTQVRIFGSYKENRFLAPEYVLELESITDKNKKLAWAQGSWDITSGGMFDDVWSSSQNVVAPFNVPTTWRVFRSFDWGSSHPFSVGWWAESDGCDILLSNGEYKSTLPGDLFRINEWYGWNGVANGGLRMLATDITKGIIQRELKWGLHGRVKIGPADSAINTRENNMCIADDMAKKVIINGKAYRGIKWSNSIKTAGSRVAGWEKMRMAIVNAQSNGYPREKPGLFVVNTCNDGFIRTVPTIARDKINLDDVDTNSEDHTADETRYVILSVGTRFVSGTTTGLF